MKPMLTVLTGEFTIHRLPPATAIPTLTSVSPFFAILRTEEELSLVFPDSVKIESEKSEPGWMCFKVEGPLEFELVGILAGISSVLAEAGVSIFALSTFDTDYILVKREQLEVAQEALTSAGYRVDRGER